MTSMWACACQRPWAQVQKLQGGHRAAQLHLTRHYLIQKRPDSVMQDATTPQRTAPLQWVPTLLMLLQPSPTPVNCDSQVMSCVGALASLHTQR